MNYVSLSYSHEEQVDFAYVNLHPNYRSKIERDQVRSLDDLEAKEEQLEAARLLSREYRPPPSPRDSLFPEHACNGPAANKRSSVAAAFVANGVNSSNFAPSLPPNQNRNRKDSKVKNSSPSSPPLAYVTNAPTSPANIKLPSNPKSQGNASTSSEAKANISAQTPPANTSQQETKVKKNLNCYWCAAPDVTVRSCQNASCVERRKLRGNGRRGRRYGSS